MAVALAAAQDAPSTLQITGAVKQSLTLSADDLGKMPRATVYTSPKLSDKRSPPDVPSEKVNRIAPQ